MYQVPVIQGVPVASRRIAFLIASIIAITVGATIGATAASADPVVRDTEAASSSWAGDVASGRLGAGLANIGDVNGDGRDDFATNVAQASRGVWVLFGSPKPNVERSINNLPPDQGYRIRFPSGTPAAPRAIGDQNGDGVPDLIVGSGSTWSVVYGVKDPANELPECSPGSVVHCLDFNVREDVDGNRLGFNLVWTDPDGNYMRAGDGMSYADFDGDGKDELVIPLASSAGGTNMVLVLRNNAGELCDPDPGLCTVDAATIAPPDALTYTTSPGTPFGGLSGDRVAGIGDVNGDGKDDVVAVTASDGAAPTRAWVLYGNEMDAGNIDLDDLSSDLGYKIDGAFDATFIIPFKTGDVTGDGTDDFAVSSVSLLSGPFYTVWHGGPPAADSTLSAPASGDGFRYVFGASWPFGLSAIGIGDVNGDGRDDLAMGQYNTDLPFEVGASAGLTSILFGPGPASGDITIDASTPGDVALTIGGTEAGARFGTAVTGAGDQDSDGRDDLLVSSSYASAGGFAQAGKIYEVRSATIAGSATTGIAGAVTDKAATLSGSARANGRSSETYFEYGTDGTYGSKTDSQSIGDGYNSQSVEGDLSGLTSDTEYHYRTVVVNDLGVKSYGQDRTFKTKAVEPSRCEADPKAPGCPEYRHCEANPTDPDCQKEPKVARLSNLIIGQKTLRVKRGKRGNVGLTVVNTGNAAARGIRLCVTGPKRFVAVQKCKRIGSLAAGKVATRAFKVKVKKRARKGKVIALKLTAKANQLGTKTARVKVRVR